MQACCNGGSTHPATTAYLHDTKPQMGWRGYQGSVYHHIKYGLAYVWFHEQPPFAVQPSNGRSDHIGREPHMDRLPLYRVRLSAGVGV
jgi:hypothetical protein